MSSLEDLNTLRGKNKQLLTELKEQGKILQSLSKTLSQVLSGRGTELETSTLKQNTTQLVGIRNQATDPISTITTSRGEKQEDQRRKTKDSGVLVEKFLTLGGHQDLVQAGLSRSQACDAGRLTSQPLNDNGRGEQDEPQTSMEFNLPQPSTEDPMIGHKCFPENSDFLLHQESSSSNHARRSNGDEHHLVSERHPLEPLLGYDWIAGVLDGEGSVTDCSEQFFADLNRFRLLNRQECVHSLRAGAEVDELSPSSLSPKRKPQDTEEAHKCTFCFRINSRLFPTPLDLRAACPVCRMPKAQHPHAKGEPAFVRISIPRSALVPSYWYGACGWSSFDPSNSLGLPSHCLSGCCNTSRTAKDQLSSLDLRRSLDRAPPDCGFTAKPKGQRDISVCRVTGPQQIKGST